MDDNNSSTDNGGGKNGSLKSRLGDKVDEKAKAIGQNAGDRVGQGIETAKQAAQSAKRVGETAAQTFGPGGGAKASKGAQGLAKAGGGASGGGDGKSPLQKGLNSLEGESKKAEGGQASGGIQTAEATAKTAVRGAGVVAAAGLAAVGDEAHAAQIIKNIGQQIAEHPVQFIKETKVGLMVIGGLAALTGLTLLLMFTFLINFAVTHVGEVAKDTALKLTTVDEAYNAGRAVVTGVGKGIDSVGDAIFGVSDIPQAKLAVANTADNLAQRAPPGNVTFAQASGNEQTETTISRLADEVDFTKILLNLGESGKLKVLSGGQEVPLDQLNNKNLPEAQLQIGKRKITIPSDPTDSEFMRELTLAIRETDLFAHSSRMMLSEEIKKMYSDTGVKLERWEGSAEDITDYGKNMQSAFKSVSAGNMSQATTNLKDIDAAGSNLESSANELLEANPSAADKNFVQRAINKAWAEEQGEGGTATVADFAALKKSPALFTIASYCSAKSFTDDNMYKQIVTQQYRGAIRNGIKILSAGDQIASGNVRKQAVGSESQRHEGYESSRSYLKAINADVRTREPDLNESQLGTLDPFVVHKAMEAVVATFEAPFSNEGFVSFVTEQLGGGGGGGFFDGIVEGVVGAITDVLNGALDILGGDDILSKVGELLCEGMSNSESQIAVRIADQISGGGPGSLGQAGVINAVKTALQDQGATVMITQLGLDGSVFDKPTEEMMYFMFNSHKAMNYAGLDDGVNLASKEFEGAAAFGNEMSRASGGRPLTPAECAAAKSVTQSQDITIRNEKPLLARLFSPEETYSPTALALAHVPLSTNGAVSKTKTALQTGINPLNTVAATTQKLAYATSLAGNEAFAQAQAGNFVEDRQLCYGFSLEEREKITTDPSYWPIQNAQIVENGTVDSLDFDALKERYGVCYDQPLSELISDLETDPTKSTNPFLPGSKCSSEGLSSDSALRFRIHRADTAEFKSLAKLKEVSATSAGAPNGPLPEGGVTIDQTTVTQGCGGIRVHTSIAEKVERLCSAAALAGKNLTGGGWRDPAEQIRLREAHCGPTEYDIYEKPSSQCSPPTARPGTSMHEKGLAIDFDGIGECPTARGGSCEDPGNANWVWLSENAATYGLIQLKKEAWHWSTNGN